MPGTTADRSPGSGRLRFAQVSADRGIAPGATKGAAQHLRGVAAGLVALGHRVETFTPRTPEGPFPVPVHDLDQLDQAVAHVDVVYERYSLGHRHGLDLARRHGLPFVLEVNAPLVAEAGEHRPGTVGADDADTERFLLAQADLVITVSTQLSEWAAGHRSGPTVTLANGFEPDWFLADRSPSGPERDLVFIGHPKPWHGADRIIDLLVELDSMGHQCDALIIGGGPGVHDLVAKASALGVGERVDITGALAPERASLELARGEIALAPYRPRDPFYFCPLKIVDYMAAGLAIVASDIGDVSELVGRSACLVDPADDRALVETVAAVLVDGGRRSELGRAARTRAFESMTWTHVAERTVAALAGLAAPTGAVA